MQFTVLTSTIVIGVLSLFVAGSPTPAPVANLMTVDQFKNWLDNTDANVTFVGKPIGDLSDLSKRNPLNTIVTFCTERADSVCGGTCSVYNGGPTCINAAGTNCLSATNNVAFCGSPACGGICNEFASCGTLLGNGFCFTPATQSILVSA